VKRTNKFALFALLLALNGYSSPAPAATNDNTPIVKITASKFHFTPDHITLVKGQPVTLELTSTDATHGFMIRALKIDTDLKPGKTLEIPVTPGAAGTFRAICDHYCGLGHSGMKMTIVVEESAAKSLPAQLLSSASTSLK
jgi:cytochrome c oxidase subunit 2